MPSALDVFDLGTNSWVSQPTQVSVLPPRVNHCATRGTARIGSELHHQICTCTRLRDGADCSDVFGGQPLGGTTQYNDLFILSLPSFTWTVASAPNPPGPRAGHSCDLIGSQLVLIGGAS